MFNMRPVNDFHIGACSPGFANRVRRLLQVKQAAHYENGYKSGKISGSRIYKAGMPIVGDGDWNSRVFKQRKQNGEVMDTAIQILVDWSGSMGGKKSTAAAKATGLVNDAFSRVLRIPVEILTFSCVSDAPTIGIIKSFDRQASADQIANRFHAFLSHMAGNNDADSLQFAYQRLIRRKEKRKILIVMSDGCPADGIGDPSFALKQVVNDIIKKGGVELYGIGILDRNVSRFYPKYRVLHDHSEIESCLIQVLSETLT